MNEAGICNYLIDIKSRNELLFSDLFQKKVDFNSSS